MLRELLPLAAGAENWAGLQFNSLLSKSDSIHSHLGNFVTLIGMHSSLLMFVAGHITQFEGPRYHERCLEYGMDSFQLRSGKTSSKKPLKV
jgi:hypothetical protein